MLACLVEVPCDDMQVSPPVSTGNLYKSAQQLRVLEKHANDEKLHNCEGREFMK